MHFPASLTAFALLISSAIATQYYDTTMMSMSSSMMPMGTGMSKSTPSISIPSAMMMMGTSMTSKTSTMMMMGTSMTTKTVPMLMATGIHTNTTTMMMMGTGMSSKTTTSTTTHSSTTIAMPLATSTVIVHVIKVSNPNGTLTFTPNSLTASPGSLVQFQFSPMNHSVVQSTFNNPCIPISDIQPATRGFFSGFMPTTGTITPIFTLEINDTTPLWYYCSQGMHCQAGMVGVINPPANETIAQFAALAKMAPVNLSPGMMVPNMTAMKNATMTTMAPLMLQTKSEASLRNAVAVTMVVGFVGVLSVLL